MHVCGKTQLVLASFRPQIPKFYRTLRFKGKIEDGNLETLRGAPKEGKDEYFTALKGARRLPLCLRQQYIR